VSHYSSRQVCEILGISPAMVKRFVAAGLVSPARGPGRRYRFNFRDIILLRTAKGLAEAQLPPRRISRSLRGIRDRLPAELPLSGLRITALRDTVVVAEGGDHWRAQDGQYLLSFAVAAGSARGQLHFIEAAAVPPVGVVADREGQRWFEKGCRLERGDPEGALEAYAQSARAEPGLAGAWVNWGRLLHDLGRLAEAAQVYEDGMAACPADALLRFNLAVLLEDQDQPAEAERMYREALARDATLADAHYNLGLLCRASERPQEALRHLAAHRKQGKKDL
jgi:tetratricopeptide (TPR) repeat protein